MIDWLTMRIPVGPSLGPALHERIMASMGRVIGYSPDGERTWIKNVLDLDDLRSDTPGLFWQLQGDAEGRSMLVIGASPASLEHGINVFGSDDIRHCAAVLLHYASISLTAILPPAEHWQCRRIDVTENYALPGFREVKSALRILMASDASRAKASTMKGDTVGWNVGSDLRAGKAYHKGPQLAFLARKGLSAATQYQIDLADRLLRLELKLGSRWLRQFEDSKHFPELAGNWLALSPDHLMTEHSQYFGRFFGAVEVSDMTQLLVRLEAVSPTPGIALASHKTWALIKSIGFESTKLSMPHRTFMRHMKYLRLAGLSDSDLCAGNILPFRRHNVILNEPVRSWRDLELQVARMAA